MKCPCITCPPCPKCPKCYKPMRFLVFDHSCDDCTGSSRNVTVVWMVTDKSTVGDYAFAVPQAGYTRKTKKQAEEINSQLLGGCVIEIIVSGEIPEWDEDGGLKETLKGRYPFKVV